MVIKSNTLIVSNNSSDLSFHIYPPINLNSNEQHEIGLVGLTMYNSIPNIDNTNNVFKFQYKGEDYEITIPHGAYEISSLNDFIKKEINSKFEFDNLLEIKANSNTLRCVIELNDNELIVNFNHENSLKDVLGFNVLQIEGKGSHEGINLANVNPVNSILVNCSAVQGSYLNGTQKPILYSFTPNVPPGYRIVENIFSPVFLPISDKNLEYIKIWLTDQNLNRLNVRGEEVTLRLELRSRKSTVMKFFSLLKMESLNWKQSVYRDDSIKKTNIREYSPHTGINLNDAYSDIHIEIQNQDQFLLPG